MRDLYGGNCQFIHLQGKQCHLEGGLPGGHPGGSLDGIKVLTAYQLSSVILAGISGVMLFLTGSGVLSFFLGTAENWREPLGFCAVG